MTVITQDNGLAVGGEDGIRVIRWRASERPARVYYSRRPFARWEVAYRLALSELALSRARRVAMTDGKPFDILDTWLWGAEACRYRDDRYLGQLVVRLSSPDFELRQQEGEAPRPDLDRLDQICLDKARVVAAISEENLNKVANHFLVDPVKVVSTPLGIALPKEPVPSHTVASSRCVLYVGRLEPRKGTQEFIEALPAILEADESITASIVGRTTGVANDGSSFRTYFERVVPHCLHERVTFHGSVSDAELDRAYRRAGLAVFPSRYESFGLVILEALAYGVPVVASRVGGIPEIMDDSMGRLTPPRDSTALASAVGSLMKDDAQRAAMGQRGADHVRRHFTVGHMLDRTLDAYMSALPCVHGAYGDL